MATTRTTMSTTEVKTSSLCYLCSVPLVAMLRIMHFRMVVSYSMRKLKHTMESLQELWAEAWSIFQQWVVRVVVFFLQQERRRSKWFATNKIEPLAWEEEQLQGGGCCCKQDIPLSRPSGCLSSTLVMQLCTHRWTTLWLAMMTEDINQHLLVGQIAIIVLFGPQDMGYILSCSRSCRIKYGIYILQRLLLVHL